MNPILMAVALALPLWQQAESGGAPENPARGRVAREELVMERFSPRHTSPLNLYHVAHDLMGTQFLTRDSQRTVDNLRLFDETVLIYDTAERARDILALLEKLDRIAGEEQMKRDAEKEARAAARGVPPARVQSREYRPRFLSLEDVHEALSPYRERAPGSFSFVSESGFVVLTGDPAFTDEVVSFLERVDAPAPQLLITCYLVRGTDQPAANPAPKALADGLGELLGYEHLDVRARAVLRTSVSARHLSLRLDVADEREHYELELSPAAYDATRDGLTLGECRLLRGVSGSMTQIFRTQTTVFGGEYTVLGATGVTPQLVVLQCQGEGPATGADGGPR